MSLTRGSRSRGMPKKKKNANRIEGKFLRYTFFFFSQKSKFSKTPWSYRNTKCKRRKKERLVSSGAGSMREKKSWQLSGLCVSIKFTTEIQGLKAFNPLLESPYRHA